MEFDDYPLRGMVGDFQLVEINGKLGYAWGGDEFLKIGDLVILPTKNDNGEWLGAVTGLGSRWPGEFKQVIRKARLEDVEAYEMKLEQREQARLGKTRRKK
jgi:hypothetical protein